MVNPRRHHTLAAPWRARLGLLVILLILMPGLPGPALAAWPAQQSPSPFDFVGVYRIEGVTREWQVDRQFTVYLNTDYSASVEWTTLFNDTQVNNVSRGAWQLIVDFVKITLIEQDGRPYDQPLIADLFFFDGFIVKVVVDGESDGPLRYRFTLGAGDTHPAVGRLHELLAGIAWLGYRDPGPGGAIYDEDTRRAVLAFQQSQGLLPSGIVDAATWMALHNPQPPGSVPTSTPPPTYLPPAGSTPVPTRAPPTPEPTVVLPTATPEPPVAPPPVPQPASCAPAGVINDLARLRAGPGTNYAALTMMPARAQVQVTARNPAGDWYQIVHDGQAGWVFGGLINLVCADELPVVDAPPPTPGPAQPPPPPAQPQPQAGDKVLYFTFDDGPNAAWTPQMLDILARYNARGVFFQIGQQVPAFQDVSRRVIAEGHTIGNHTWDHPSLAGMDEAAFNDQIARTDQALTEVGAFQNAGRKCMRPPYGATDGNTRARLEALGYTMMLWHLDTNDWRLPGADQIVRYVLDNAFPGAIVLMHDGGGNRAQSAAALEVILQTLGSQGWRFESACR